MTSISLRPRRLYVINKVTGNVMLPFSNTCPKVRISDVPFVKGTCGLASVGMGSFPGHALTHKSKQPYALNQGQSQSVARCHICVDQDTKRSHLLVIDDRQNAAQ